MCSAPDGGLAPDRRRLGWVVLPVLAGLLLLTIAGVLAYDAGRNEGMRDERTSARQGPVPQTALATASAGGGTDVTVAGSVQAPSGPAATRPQTVTAVPQPVPLAAVVREPEPAAQDTTDCLRYAAQIEGPMRRWDALVQGIPNATSVTRDRTIAELRAIESQVGGIAAPSCAQGARDELVASMAAVIEALWRTPTAEDPSANGAFAAARDQLSQARRQLEAIASRR
jgi:hypothetical protein